jgi:hypothetical protein
LRPRSVGRWQRRRGAGSPVAHCSVILGALPRAAPPRVQPAVRTAGAAPAVIAAPARSNGRTPAARGMTFIAGGVTGNTAARASGSPLAESLRTPSGRLSPRALVLILTGRGVTPCGFPASASAIRTAGAAVPFRWTSNRQTEFRRNTAAGLRGRTNHPTELVTGESIGAGVRRRIATGGRPGPAALPIRRSCQNQGKHVSDLTAGVVRVCGVREDMIGYRGLLV